PRPGGRRGAVRHLADYDGRGISAGAARPAIIGWLRPPGRHPSENDKKHQKETLDRGDGEDHEAAQACALKPASRARTRPPFTPQELKAAVSTKNGLSVWALISVKQTPLMNSRPLLPAPTFPQDPSGLIPSQG